MGEIRSTLDIIMEKTKDMTLSDHERLELKEKEITDRVRGLVSRLLDSVITYDRFEAEIGSFDEKDKETALKALIEVVIPLIVPGEDNNLRLKVLENSGIVYMDTVRDAIKGAEVQIDKERVESGRSLLKRLSDKGISGSAVIPNPESDADWSRKLTRIREGLIKRLNSSIGGRRQGLP